MLQVHGFWSHEMKLPKLNDTFRQFDDDLDFENSDSDVYANKKSDVETMHIDKLNGDENKVTASDSGNVKVFSPATMQADSSQNSIALAENQLNASQNNIAAEVDIPVVQNSSVNNASENNNAH